MGGLRYTWRTFALEICLIVGAVLFCVPVYLLVSISLKKSADAYLHPLSFPSAPNWAGYSQALRGSAYGDPGVGSALVSSAIITVGSVVFLIALGSMAGYVLGRRTCRLSASLYVTFMIGILVPAQLGLVPLYSAMRSLHLVDSYVGVTVLYVGQLMPLTVFLYAGFVRALPRDYEEAADVDGASQFRIFTRVVLPLLLPITGTVAVLDGMLVWNDFFVQLVFLSGSHIETLPVTIYNLAGANVAQWNVIFAGVVVSIVPLMAFFVFAQRAMVHGFSGGVKE